MAAPAACFSAAAERTAGVASTSAPVAGRQPHSPSRRRDLIPILSPAPGSLRRIHCRGFNFGDFGKDGRGLGADLRRLLGLDAGDNGGGPIGMSRDDPSLPSMDDSGQPWAPRFSAGARPARPAGPKAPPPATDWSAGPDEDWEDWSGAPPVADLDDEGEVAELREAVIARRQARRGRRTRVRDEYLRPIVDPTGIYNRLAIREKEAEERVFVEAITNQYESREALGYGAILLAVPLTVGFVVSRLLAQPLWEYAQGINPEAFALNDEQKVAGAEAMHKEELRLRMEASIGQAPALNDVEMLQHLRSEARRFESGMRQYNQQALLNVVSDSTTASTLFLLLLQDNSQRTILFRTFGRVFAGMSDTAKAFLIILGTDILLGYHSEEGWTAALTLLSGHYGWHAEKSSLQLFVATVPVLMDALFKYWIFVGLNKIDPAAAVTLRQMDRH